MADKVSLKDWAEINRLKEHHRVAKQLGFQDDMDHWASELRKLGVDI